ncbi:helix-turn-helix domain-containing protein [Paenibacillus sp. FSL R5-0887]|jgi:transcriptional regulator GlxA family with amidase domain|uniref:helix-turn-helix domain-containing protein n=1 Tax=Paenibacillus TaxID=44249 RepID=UPI00096D557A|nr:helix-turn-helix domain-containing protein [Paenibacillus odorifer]
MFKLLIYTYRHQEARALLINTAFKVAKIAENFGFDNMTHFGRVFKEITGLSPLKYRQTYKIESP